MIIFARVSSMMAERMDFISPERQQIIVRACPKEHKAVQTDSDADIVNDADANANVSRCRMVCTRRKDITPYIGIAIVCG